MVLRFLLAIMVMLTMVGCESRTVVAHIDPPDAGVEALDSADPGTAAEEDVKVKKDAADKARASGNVLATLEAERALALSRVRLGKHKVKQWEQTAKDKDTEISDEKDRERQSFLHVFSGICGFLSVLATAGAIFWPTTRIVTRPAAVLLGGLVLLSLFAAWLVPYIPYVALGCGALAVTAGGWYLSRNERMHRLKDKTATQVAAAVEESKTVIPEFAANYKSIFRGHIDDDADDLMNARRLEVSHMEADEAARVAKLRAV